MTKARLVFERDGTFLSFPLSPVAFAPKQLRFSWAGISSNQDVLDLSEFSRLVNLIPAGMTWPPTESRYLWDSYSDAIDSPVRLAKSTRSAEEDEAFDTAYKLLHGAVGDGLLQDTPKFLEYKRHRDALFTAQEDYNNQKISAELSGDPAVKQNWSQTVEPLLRQKLDALRQEWDANGNKTEIENALRAIETLGAKAPEALWAKWRTLFVPEIDKQTDTNHNQFALCNLSPSNVLGTDGWSRFGFSGPEADALVAQSTPELKTKLAPSSVDLEIESLSVELTSVAITRPWFVTDVLTARFWRFLDQTRLLSDGGTIPKGELPAYVAALVLARNLEIKLKAASPGNDGAIKRIEAGKAINLGFVRVGAILSPPAAMGTRVLGVKALARLPVGDGSPARVVGPAVRVIPAAARAAAIAPPAARSPIAVPRRAPATVHPATAHVSAMPLEARIRLSEFYRKPIAPVFPGGHPLGPPTTPPTADREAIYVMAFICKRVNRCPDPDPQLHW